MNRTTHMTGIHTSDVGKIKTMQSSHNTKFYIEIEFFNPLPVVEVAELCKDGDLYGYAKGLVDRLKPEGE